MIHPPLLLRIVRKTAHTGRIELSGIKLKLVLIFVDTKFLTYRQGKK